MDLVLRRKPSTKNSTIGELEVNGVFECYTIEDIVRPEGVKVPGQTAIPAGKYRIDVTYSQRFQKLMPILINVPNFTGVRIHAGNTARDTEGCIIVGKTSHIDYISQSRDAYDALFRKINQAMGRDEEVWLEIINA